LSSNVDAIAEYIAVIMDHIAEVDTHAISDTLILALLGLAFGHRGLDDAVQGAIRRGEFNEHAIARGIHDPAAIAGNFGINQLLAVQFLPGQNTFLAPFHKAGVAGHIGSKDSSETAFHAHLQSLF
jgi:TctA family transporter